MLDEMLLRAVTALERIADALEQPAPEPAPEPEPVRHPADWDDENPCWAHQGEEWVDALPIGHIPIVPIRTDSPDFYTNLTNTVKGVGKRCIVQLEEGVYELTAFRRIGTSGDPKYAFGFWHQHLAGLLGRGPERTFVQMRGNSMSNDLLDAIQAMRYADAGNWATLQTGVLRLDGTDDSPICVGGLTFRSADQQDITRLDASFDKVKVQVPQPAPHRGLQIYKGSTAFLSHVRFQAFGRAVTSAPPFECASLHSQRSRTALHRVEIDGRRSVGLDIARPKRSAIYLMNDESDSRIADCHFHDSNVSRYAVNDENYDTRGTYVVIRTKIERITTDRNDGYGGWTDASCMGWESSSADIVITDCIISMDNSNTDSGQKPMHFQFTMTGGQYRVGGLFTVRGTQFRSSGQPDLEGFATVRLGRNTQWCTQDDLLHLHHPETGARLAPYAVTSWPPTATNLASAGITSKTHYLIQLV